MNSFTTAPFLACLLNGKNKQTNKQTKQSKTKTKTKKSKTKTKTKKKTKNKNKTQSKIKQTNKSNVIRRDPHVVL